MSFCAALPCFNLLSAVLIGLHWSVYEIAYKLHSLFPFQWTTCTILCRSDSFDVWVSPFARSHIQRSETWEPSHWPPRLHSSEPNATNEYAVLLCLIFPHFTHVCYICFWFLGDRFWICQEGKRQDLDIVWDTGVPGTRNHSQQSMDAFFFFLNGCIHTKIQLTLFSLGIVVLLSYFSN